MQTYFKYIEVGKAVFIMGHISVREDEAPKVILDTAKLAAEVKSEREKRKGLFIRVPSSECDEYAKVSELIGHSRENGDINLYFYFSDTKKYFPIGKIKISENLLLELKKIAGENNVILQQ